MNGSLLKVRNLKKNFGSISPVKGISFQIERGSCTALLGPNGAGKTTTLRMLAGLMDPSSGSVEYTGSQQMDSWRNRIGYLPQYPKFYGWMTGREYIIFSAEISGLRGRKASERTDEVLALVGLKDAAKRRISGYSGGMKQRLGLAQALVHEPELLLLDEPVSALDPLGRREVMDMIRELSGDKITILFSTHVLHDAEEICDEMVFMVDGLIAEQGSLNELRAKYRQPVIYVAIEPEGNGTQWLKSLTTRSFVTDAEIGRDWAKLTVDDIAAARRKLMEEISTKALPLVRFEAGTSSLEDMFMKVVSR
ncbi:ABC-2 type transport system ATP-binding protein [Paenibacillus uliginis N3/975]|uniref:ABC-2 type transport system ATP-binding protein n=1 Tax=Paenibacillus uliginis N3/975 TaxID=1313296 RepID=A0A1X7GKX4_9BACL|nr:ABC transporter ATP-binding protein [Paenibacillus uliginis]SMF71257.1 ABC-2 type transport system ATP-binding protein [Paenibacillus uliginis N3/975]